MNSVGGELQKYLKKFKLLCISCQNFTPALIEQFLETFKSSASYYMTKRSSLAGVFTRMVRCGMIVTNLVTKTSRKKYVPVLNKAFTKAELIQVLDFLKEAHTYLYLCALLMYGCFLRPHREVRCLKVKHLSRDCSTITLGGDENKGKRIRIIHVPPYVQKVLLSRITELSAASYHIISGTISSYNSDYFKTA
jgi:integrase